MDLNTYIIHVTSKAMYQYVHTYIPTYLHTAKQCYLFVYISILCIAVFQLCCVCMQARIDPQQPTQEVHTYLLLSLHVGCTALHLAAAHGKTSCVELLLRSGAVSLRKYTVHTVHTYTVHKVHIVLTVHKVHTVHIVLTVHKVHTVHIVLTVHKVHTYTVHKVHTYIYST